MGLQSRSAALIAGATSLIAYGELVTSSELEFGRLMGTYSVIVYVVSQVVAMALFSQIPAPRALLGGAPRL